MIIEYMTLTKDRNYSKDTWSKTEKVLVTLLILFLIGLITYGVM